MAEANDGGDDGDTVLRQKPISNGSPDVGASICALISDRVACGGLVIRIPKRKRGLSKDPSLLNREQKQEDKR